MQDFLTNQWGPKPNALLVTAYPSTHTALSGDGLPHPRGPRVISDVLLFLFLHTPHSQLSNPVTFAPVQSVQANFPKLANSNIARSTCSSGTLSPPHQEVETIFSPLKPVTASWTECGKSDGTWVQRWHYKIQHHSIRCSHCLSPTLSLSPPPCLSLHSPS